MASGQPSLALAAKRKRFRPISGRGLPACCGRLEDSRERKPARRRTHDSGRFLSKRCRKGTRLIQEQPVTGWIWRSWDEAKTWVLGQNPSREQTPSVAEFAQRLDVAGPSIPGNAAF
jgi:hypothetical protein